ncbi:hypothetical protein GWN26_13450, partial [Candidatus Saccharibacteria bacterium]|nr:hypothetical protein [Candidatus Saccharibacteria bacterium]
MESKLSSLQKIRAEMKTELDSLKIIYEVQIRRIDQEKNHRIPDKKKITQLMSEALSVSDQLEKKKKEMS